MLWIALARASSGPLLATAAPENDAVLTMGVAGRPTPQGHTYLFTSNQQRSFGHHVAGLHIGGVEHQARNEKWGMFSFSAHYGYRVVDHRRVVVMPFLHVGAFVQPGLALRAHVPIGEARLGTDASVGYTWEIPGFRHHELERDVRFGNYGVKPEAGVWLNLGGPLNPTGRVGVLGSDVVVSAQVGGNVFARAALTVNPFEPLPTGWVSVGIRVGDRGESHPGPFTEAD